MSKNIIISFDLLNNYILLCDKFNACTQYMYKVFTCTSLPLRWVTMSPQNVNAFEKIANWSMKG